MSKDVLSRAVDVGILDAKDVDLVGRDQCEALRIMLFFMDGCDCRDPSEFDFKMYGSELAELTDMVDLKDCDKVVDDKSFLREELNIVVPEWIVPVLRERFFPAVRSILE